MSSRAVSRDRSITAPEEYKSHLVILDPGPREDLASQVRRKFDIPVVDSRAWSPEGPGGDDARKRAVIFANLGVALVNLSRAELAGKFEENNVISDIRLRLPGNELGDLSEFLSGERCRHDERQNSWGRKLTGVSGSTFTGKGVRVCVVDSGLAPHSDFHAQGLDQLLDRHGRAKAFTSGNSINTDDTLGHGTHCAGIICGKPARNPLYGVAPECELFVADVFGAATETDLGQTVAGIEWALDQHCDIISMSLFWDEDPTSDRAAKLRVNQFKRVVDRAVMQKALLLACTGNLSDRNGINGPVRIENCCFPANQPNIIAVGAVDKCKGLLNKANRGADIAGPGESVLSTKHLGIDTDSGTSMATAFVAGIAALHAQTPAKPRGAQLATALLGSISPLPGVVNPLDLKTGLVKAP